MNYEDFETVFNNQVQRSQKVLLMKSGEYATPTDKLHNFKVAAALKGSSPVEALGGMMIKHIVSVYDLINRHEAQADISRDLWDEKITDAINYLILLKACLVEEYSRKAEQDFVQESVNNP